MSTKSGTIRLAIAKPVFKTLVLGTGILAAKMFLTNLYSTIPTHFSGSGAPEDSFFWRLFGAPKQSHGAHASKDSLGQPTNRLSPRETQLRSSWLRSQRIIMNDLENIPMSVIVFWIAVLANPEKGQDIEKLFTVFVGGRCLHSLFYLSGIPVLRSGAYMAGLVSTLRALFFSLQGVGVV